MKNSNSSAMTKNAKNQMKKVASHLDNLLFKMNIVWQVRQLGDPTSKNVVFVQMLRGQSFTFTYFDFAKLNPSGKSGFNPEQEEMIANLKEGEVLLNFYDMDGFQHFQVFNLSEGIFEKAWQTVESNPQVAESILAS